MKLSLLTTVSLYLFAIHLIFATNGLRTRPSLKKSLQQQQQQQQQQQKHQQKNANENRLPYEHILRARYRDYEDRERRNQKLRLLAEENDKKKKKKALLQKESESLNSQYHHDSSEADTYPNAPERDDDPYPYQEREPQSSKGFSPPRGFQAEAFNPGYQPTGFKDEAPGHYSLDPPPPTSTNAKRKHFNIHRHNQKPKHVSYNVKNQFQGGGYEESSPLPAVPSSLIGHRPDMNKQALVTEAPESALRWVDSKFIHNQHGTFTNQVLTEFVPLNDWSNYHKQFTFLVNDNVDAEMPIDHEEAGQSYRRSDQSPDYDYEDKPEDKRRYSPQERSTGITARSDPGYERHHHREEEVEPFASDPLPPPGNPVYDGYTKIDQLYRSNYWD